MAARLRVGGSCPSWPSEFTWNCLKVSAILTPIWPANMLVLCSSEGCFVFLVVNESAPSCSYSDCTDLQVMTCHQGGKSWSRHAVKTTYEFSFAVKEWLPNLNICRLHVRTNFNWHGLTRRIHTEFKLNKSTNVSQNQYLQFIWPYSCKDLACKTGSMYA